jgi:tetratricopeptide (TPR) repeat protein
MNALAAAYWRLRRLDQSIPLFEESIKLQETKLGRPHPETLLAAGNLGVNYRDAGRFRESIPLLEETYRASKTYPKLRFVGLALVDAYRQVGETGKFTDLIDELLPAERKALPSNSPQLADLLALFGSGLLEQKKWPEAESALRECLAIREKTRPDAWNTFNIQSLLGGALLGQKKYTDAEPLLLKGYEGMKQREKSIPPPGATRLPEAIDRLIELAIAMNRSEEVKKWQVERAKYPIVKR